MVLIECHTSRVGGVAPTRDVVLGRGVGLFLMREVSLLPFSHWRGTPVFLWAGNPFEQVFVVKCHTSRVGGVAPTRDGRMHSFAQGQGVVFRWAPPRS